MFENKLNARRTFATDRRVLAHITTKRAGRSAEQTKK